MPPFRKVRRPCSLISLISICPFLSILGPQWFRMEGDPTIHQLRMKRHTNRISTGNFLLFMWTKVSALWLSPQFCCLLFCPPPLLLLPLFTLLTCLAYLFICLHERLQSSPSRASESGKDRSGCARRACWPMYPWRRTTPPIPNKSFSRWEPSRPSLSSTRTSDYLVQNGSSSLKVEAPIPYLSTFPVLRWVW